MRSLDNFLNSDSVLCQWPVINGTAREETASFTLLPAETAEFCCCGWREKREERERSDWALACSHLPADKGSSYWQLLLPCVYYTTRCESPLVLKHWGSNWWYDINITDSFCNFPFFLSEPSFSWQNTPVEPVICSNIIMQCWRIHIWNNDANVGLNS